MEPDALVTTGVFARTRNPIYLGDAAILAGLVLFWQAWPSLVLVPLFVWLITDRFIRPEEERLHARFGVRFEQWAQRTRRWL
jgi:protein-S-isoprenylcysteine O-methyltransferase Ste14